MKRKCIGSMKIIVGWFVSRATIRSVDPYQFDPYLMRDIGLVPRTPRKPYFEYL